MSLFSLDKSVENRDILFFVTFSCIENRFAIGTGNPSPTENYNKGEIYNRADMESAPTEIFFTTNKWSINNYALRITNYALIYFLSTISEQTRFENASGSSIGIPSIRSASV